LEFNRDELEFLAGKNNNPDLIATLEHVASSPFARVTYTEVIDILKKAQAAGHKFEFAAPDWGGDLATEHERYMCEIHFKKPTIVTDYPKEIKAFYMKQNPDGKTVRCMDILVPGVGEIIGGSQREEDYDKLTTRMKEMGLDPAGYWWYTDLRRFGTTPHAGFGLGFERAVMYVTGMTNIRDVIAFPRTPKNAEF
jgi:asparaginyl-tRNA synthetase